MASASPRLIAYPSGSGTQPATETCIGYPGMGLARHELGGRGGDAGPDSAAEIGLDAVGDLLRAAVCLEAVQIEAELPRPLPQMRVVEVALVLQQRVVHLPELPLEASRLGGGRQHPGAWVLRRDREVPEHARDRQLLEDQVRLRAVRALEVRVLDYRRSLAARVVGRTGLRRGCAAPARQR